LIEMKNWTEREKRIAAEAQSHFNSHPDDLLYPADPAERKRLGFHFRNQFRWSRMQRASILILIQKRPN
jgi:hypothetical protein